MKLRALFTALLALAVAAPVVATMDRFPDVPADHQYAEAIRWASDPEEFNGSPLFKGFPDGRFGPDDELTEEQFVKVVDRLFDAADRWTRAETAALLYQGFPALQGHTGEYLDWSGVRLDAGIQVLDGDVIRVWVWDFADPALRGQLDISFRLDMGFKVGHDGNQLVDIPMLYSPAGNFYFEHFPYTPSLCGKRVEFIYTHPAFRGSLHDVGDNPSRDIPCLHLSATTTTTTTRPVVIETTTTTAVPEPFTTQWGTQLSCRELVNRAREHHRERDFHSWEYRNYGMYDAGIPAGGYGGGVYLNRFSDAEGRSVEYQQGEKLRADIQSLDGWTKDVFISHIRCEGVATLGMMLVQQGEGEAWRILLPAGQRVKIRVNAFDNSRNPYLDDGFPFEFWGHTLSPAPTTTTTVEGVPVG